ncbi:MAG TPA: polymer-forming cytoskeletal protein [bacterium]|jgi:cytoskeletal protein CcmA (bactofilin family)|nr:polymer-forming cytoskeletal protein [bacterium]
MFNKNGIAGAGREGIETIIGSSVKIEGNFVCQGGIVIEGEVKGTISTAGFLEVGEKAIVIADVTAKEGKIAGEVRGNIRVEGYLELSASAKIIGDIEVMSLSIARGAIIKGKCHVNVGDLKTAKNSKPEVSNDNE